MPSSNREGADAPSAAGELIDGPDKQDCSKNPGGWGRPMSDYEYIWFPQLTKLINHYINSSRFPYVLDSIHEYDCVDGWKGVGKMVLLKRDSK